MTENDKIIDAMTEEEVIYLNEICSKLLNKSPYDTSAMTKTYMHELSAIHGGSGLGTLVTAIQTSNYPY